MVYRDIWVRQSFQRIAGEIMKRINGKEPYDADWLVVSDLLGESTLRRVRGMLIEDVLHFLIVEHIVPITSNDKYVGYDPYSKELDKEIEELCFMMRIGEERRIPEGCLYLSLLVDSQTSLLFSSTLLLGLNNKLRALLILHHEKEEDKKYQALAEITKHIFPKLAYLRILYLRAVRIQKLPKTIGKLHRLRYLKLHLVDILSRYIAVYDDNHGKSICAIPELQSLTNLHQLHVLNLERVSNFAEDIQAAKVIQENTRLEHLTLVWEWWDMDSVAKAASVQIIAEGFEPNSNLRKLEMVCYMENDLPGWMKEEGVSSHLNFLVEIKLIKLKRCESLPPLGQLPYLLNVEISGMDSIKIVGDDFYGTQTVGTFPSLIKLTLSEMLMQEEWQESESDYVFPVLQELTLIQCPKFRGFDKTIYPNLYSEYVVEQ
ncbi:disease resistance protein RGA2-like [Canna indica]|uniref:Disease resistance protein RGA2-like n=1 Tax=Canna indica TaxID=4628 RepID=A0AAQ3QD61_9LILI|nr:disease resistance protein RGA2-like [Canna indica]